MTKAKRLLSPLPGVTTWAIAVIHLNLNPPSKNPRSATALIACVLHYEQAILPCSGLLILNQFAQMTEMDVDKLSPLPIQLAEMWQC